MPHHNLRDEISFCDVDGKLVFLDLRRDRYFRLGSAGEQAFRALLGGSGDVDEGEFERLRATELIVSAEAPQPIEAASAILPTRSLVERRDAGVRVHPTLLPELAARLLSARHCVSRQRLAETIAALRAGKRLPRRPSARSEALVPPYLATRRLLPFAPNCLRDSLALAFYLNRRRAPFALVFGVKLAPFAAHCWLQDDALVLNDSLDSVADFRPILVV